MEKTKNLFGYDSSFNGRDGDEFDNDNLNKNKSRN